ncbi:hypothetical protein AB0A74_30425 [Saccharothrix sp. NPDC042600]|uniref:hypothetical protein n=1 Tax=Saccharothrix TaxID=2071 RepID=UPI0033EE78B8|nr:hypothetical protein GCM10017745_39170 [Saccharothrix mutabilis subsp. capreolus]
MAAVLLTAVLVSPASACVCFPGNEALRYQQAKYVFSGLVVARKIEQKDGYNDKYRYTVKVHTEYKGDVPRWVYVTTQINYSCRYELTVGTEYVVFSKSDLVDRRLEIDQCGGTRPASAGPPVTTSPSSGTSTTPPTTPCATAAA